MQKSDSGTERVRIDGRFEEDRDKIPAEYTGKEGNRTAHQQGCRQSDTKPLTDSCILLRSEILRSVAGERVSERIYRGHDERVDLESGGVPGNDGRSEAVDFVLHK